MSAAAKSASIGTVLVAIPGEELRRQLAEFLATEGYAFVPAPTVGAALRLVQDSRTDPEIVIGDVPLAEAEFVAAAITAARPTVKMVFLSSEPEFVTREVVRHPAVTFLEKPFAWCELKRTLSDVQQPLARGCDAVLNAA